MWTLEETKEETEFDGEFNQDFGLDESLNTQEGEQIIDSWWTDDK